MPGTRFSRIVHRWFAMLLVGALLAPPSPVGRVGPMASAAPAMQGDAGVTPQAMATPLPTPSATTPDAGSVLFLPLVNGAAPANQADGGPLVRPAAAATPPTPSGAYAPYPLNPGLNTLWESAGAPPANGDFAAPGAATGSPPANADFSAAPYGSGDPPTNYEFGAGTLEGWSSAGTVTLDSDAVRGAFGKLASGGVLTTAPFTVTAEAQQLWVDVGYLHATATSYVEVYVLRGVGFASEIKLRTLYCQNCGWLTTAFDLTPYAGGAAHAAV